MTAVEKLDEIAQAMGDQWWRLNNLYWITDENGKAIQFKPNLYQQELYENLWYNNIILKSRQLGFTTFVSVLFLDICLFNQNHNLCTIADTLDNAEKIFRSKIRFAVEKLPDDVLAMCGGVRTMNTSSIEFGNGSKISVGVSARSGTLQGLHVSEYGKISARFPEKAREIKTGSFPAVHTGNFIFVESTAEGQDGEFFVMTDAAMKMAERGTKLTEKDFRFHFFPWWRDTKNRIEIETEVPQEMASYFEDLRLTHKIHLEPQQKWWYVRQAATFGDDMKREYPSFPKEAFEQAVIGAYYGRQMTWLRANNHIRPKLYVPGEPVYTFWDLGRNDLNAIWFMQEIVTGEFRFIDYYENNGEDLAHYVKYLKDKPYIYGGHWLPHDADNESLERGETRIDRLEELNLGRRGRDLHVVERVEDIDVGINLVRSHLPRCWFDSENCAVGIAHMDGYKKEWDAKAGTFKRTPKHDSHSNGADAFRQFAQGYKKPTKADPNRKKRRSNWRTA